MSEPYRILVCGPRAWRNPPAVKLVLCLLRRKHGDFVVIEGEANGVDIMAGVAAEQLGLTVERYPADWRYGRGAGFMRNSLMLGKNIDEVVAIGIGKGTANTISQATAKRIKVTRFYAP